MPADQLIKYRNSLEMFLIRGKLIAQQTAYVHPFLKEDSYEVKHFYCPKCGQPWGSRVQPDSIPSLHHFYSSTCRDCGGDENMLTPFEESHLEILGPEVLAYLFLQRVEEALKSIEEI